MGIGTYCYLLADDGRKGIEEWVLGPSVPFLPKMAVRV